MEWLGLAFAAMGLLFVVLGIRGWRADRRFQRVAAEADAEITDVRWETRGPVGDSSHVAFAVLRFALPDGRVVETAADSGGNWRPGKVGERVRILYDPGNPTRARMAGGLSGAAPVLASALMIVVGLLFAIVGSGWFVFFEAFDLT